MPAARSDPAASKSHYGEFGFCMGAFWGNACNFQFYSFLVQKKILVRTGISWREDLYGESYSELSVTRLSSYLINWASTKRRVATFTNLYGESYAVSAWPLRMLAGSLATGRFRFFFWLVFHFCIWPRKVYNLRCQLPRSSIENGYPTMKNMTRGTWFIGMDPYVGRRRPMILP